MLRQYLEHARSIVNAAACRDRDAEHGLHAVIVHPGAINKGAPLKRTIDRPAGEAARALLHVLLSVTAVDPQRVEFHKLSSVVLFDARFSRGRPRWGRRRILSGRFLLIFLPGHHRGVLIGARREPHPFRWLWGPLRHTPHPLGRVGIGSRSPSRRVSVLSARGRPTAGLF